MPVAIRSLARQKPPRIAWETAKNKILGTRYELSLVFTDSKYMKTLNRTYRKKSATTNVLAFPLGKNEGEIFMDLTVARREAPERQLSYQQYVRYLYIHALLHLKGFDHDTKRAGARMDNEEKKWLNALR